jgi:hypothetical protein
MQAMKDLENNRLAPTVKTPVTCRYIPSGAVMETGGGETEAVRRNSPRRGPERLKVQPGQEARPLEGKT